MYKKGNVCPDCGAMLDPGESCDCDGYEQEDYNPTRERLKQIQAAEQRNRQRITAFVDRQRQKNMHEFMYK